MKPYPTVQEMADVWASPKRFEKAFSEEDRLRVYDYLNQPGWETGWKSNSKRDAYTFLHKHFAGWRKHDDGKPEVYDCQDELQKNSPLIYDAWLTVREKIFAGHKLVRCYANAMCYGMDGTVHTDASEPGNYTAVYYPHERWSPNWGGETMFYNQRKTASWAASILDLIHAWCSTAAFRTAPMASRAATPGCGSHYVQDGETRCRCTVQPA